MFLAYTFAGAKVLQISDIRKRLQKKASRGRFFLHSTLLLSTLIPLLART